MIDGNAIANWIYWDFHNPDNPFMGPNICAEECEFCLNEPCVNEVMKGKFIFDEDTGELIEK